MERVKDLAAGPSGSAMLAPPPAMPPISVPFAAPTQVAPHNVAKITAPTTAAGALDRLVATVAGTRGAVLASIDGFPIAKSATMPAEPSHAAMLAAAVGIARQLVAMGSGTNLRQMVVDHDGGLMLVWPIGSQRVLAVLADARVDQRALRSFVQVNVRVLADRPAAGNASR